MKSNTSKISCKRGFTLIELLVVVLIIGILAAVAVPQYQLAVHKTRMMRMMPIIKAIDTAQQAYYLANGKYAGSFDDLDVELPAGGTVTATHAEHAQYVTDDVVYDDFLCFMSTAGTDTWKSVFCSLQKDGQPTCSLEKYLDGSYGYCWGMGDPLCEKSCRSLAGGGNSANGGSALGTGFKIYF